jgi:hypothetical protein
MVLIDVIEDGVDVRTMNAMNASLSSTFLDSKKRNIGRDLSPLWASQPKRS